MSQLESEFGCESADTEFREFFEVVSELVLGGTEADEEALVAVLSPLGAGEATVQLVEGDLSVRDALSYARGLSELGLAAQADEVVGAVIEALDPRRRHAARWFGAELAAVTAAA